MTADSRANDPVFALHRGGKIEVVSKVPLRDRDDLSLAYTPGVAEVCLAIADEPDLVHDYTWKGSTVAVVTDGTALVHVVSRGVPPQLFRDRIGVVVEGTMTSAGVFESQRLMVSHDNKYRAPQDKDVDIKTLMRSTEGLEQPLPARPVVAGPAP